MEEILINIIENMKKGIAFVDEYNTIRYLNNSAKVYYEKRNYKNLIGKSVFGFHDKNVNEKIQMSVRMLKNNNSLESVKVENIYIFPVRVNKKFLGYYIVIWKWSFKALLFYWLNIKWFYTKLLNIIKPAIFNE